MCFLIGDDNVDVELSCLLLQRSESERLHERLKKCEKAPLNDERKLEIRSFLSAIILFCKVIVSFHHDLRVSMRQIGRINDF